MNKKKKIHQVFDNIIKYNERIKTMTLAYKYINLRNYGIIDQKS